MADIGITLGLEGEKQFKTALSEINQSFKLLGSEMQLVASQFDKNDKSMEALAAHNEVLNKEIETQKQKIETLKQALDNASNSFRENDKRTQSWQIQLNQAQATLNTMERELDANNKALDEASQGFDEAEEAADDFGDEIKDTAGDAEEAGGKFEKLGSVLGGIGTAMTAALAAIGATVGATVSKINDCVDIYARFEDSMLQVAATMGITSEDISSGSEAYEMLTNAAKEAGSSTRYSASEAGQALNYLALAGYDAEQAVETLPKVLNLAAAGGMELATTSDLVTDAMSALQMDTSELDAFIDQLAKTSQKSNTSVQQLGEAILVCAGTATSTGQELTTVNTALGVLADNGIKGAEGGTKLRNVMLSLSSPTDKAALQLESLGVSIYDADGNMRQLEGIISDLNSSLGSLSQEERTNAIGNIFNKADLGAVNALLGATTGGISDISSALSDCGVDWSKYSDKVWAAADGAVNGVIDELIYNLQELGTSAEDLQEYLYYEYNIDADDALKIINSATEALETNGTRWHELSGYINDSTGAATEMANTMEAGLAGSARSFDSAVEGMQIEVGSIFADLKQTLMNDSIEVIRSFTQNLQEANGDWGKIGEAIGQALSDIIGLIGEYLPQIVELGMKIVQTIIASLTENLDGLTEAASVIMTLI